MGNTDDCLVTAAVAGDEAALATLLERHGVAVRQGLSISPKWRAALDPDDVMQVTYLEAFLRIETLRQPTPKGFLAWLRCIAENNLRDAIRGLECAKRPRHRVECGGGGDSYGALLQRISAGSTTPSRAAGAREVQKFVEDALHRIPPDYEKVIRLCELESKTAPEAASILGRSHGAVRMLLARAKDRLREVLGSESAFFSDTA
ncbi:MAG: RNA polymerase sigma factor [Planctomycetota bacterium]